LLLTGTNVLKWLFSSLKKWLLVKRILLFVGGCHYSLFKVIRFVTKFFSLKLSF
jgi:hypothetical protein